MSFEYPKNTRLRCNRCGLCCRDTENKVRMILLLKAEADHISEMKSMDAEKFTLKIEGSEPYVYMMKKTEEGKCVFLENNSCSIYNIRPLICRFYPFELKDLGDDSYIFIPTQECPCIGKGAFLSRSFFKRLFDEAKLLMKSGGLP